jgi:hypothetical protein
VRIVTDIGHSRPSIADPEPCPLGTRWAAWKIYVFARGASGGTHLTPEEREAVRRARRRRLSWKPDSPLAVEWSVGPGDATRLADGDGLLHRRRHMHASMKIGTRSIHIDWATGMGGGPGFSYTLVHTYVDGALVDESAHGGSSLGFTLWGGPALAVIRRGLAVGVASDWFRSAGPPTVWLMTPARGE